MVAEVMNTAFRAQLQAELSAGQWDLLVIGGGITGAGIALDAASRGLRVALVEAADFAAGTSSRSTKLIHGGLRYLKQFELGLVREVGRERAVLHRLAPYLVRPQPMLLPIVQGGTYGRWGVSIGLWVYDWLAGVKREERRRMLGVVQTLEREPLLHPKGLKGAGYYYEYQTDDARLTMAVLRTAVQKGALVRNYAAVTGLLYAGDRVAGAAVQDALTGETFEVRARAVVNAAGPWADVLRDMDGSLSGKRLHLTKGVHIVVPLSRFPLRQAVYFDVPDGRMIFAVPRAHHVYIGTTDTNYTGDKREPGITAEDRTYLLQACNAMFPEVALTEGDITGGWSGLRPLIHEDGKSPSELSRKDEIFESGRGLITIAGGKLTGYRKMAERVTDRVVQRLRAHPDGRGITAGPCQTQTLFLQGTEQYSGSAEGIPEVEWEAWQYRYGGEALRLCAEARTEMRAGMPAAEACLRAEVRHARTREACVTADDFLVRRTGIGCFDTAAADALRAQVTAFLQEG